jgi:hypothetical protein
MTRKGEAENGEGPKFTVYGSPFTVGRNPRAALPQKAKSKMNQNGQ